MSVASVAKSFEVLSQEPVQQGSFDDVDAMSSVSAPSATSAHIPMVPQQSRNHGAIMPIVSKFSDLKVVQNNAMLKQTAITQFFDTMISVGETLPKELEAYRNQIIQVKGVMGSRFTEIMADGVIDPDLAEEVLKTITEQLFDADGILGKIHNSAKDLLKSFSTLDKEEGFMTTVRVAQGAVQKKKCIAATYEKVYLALDKAAKPDYTDAAFFGSVFLPVFVVTYSLASFFLSFVVGTALCVVLLGYKVKHFGRGPVVRASITNEVERECKEVGKLLEMGSYMHMVLAAIERAVETLSVHTHALKNQQNQIRFMVKNKTIVKRFSPERLAQYLEKNSLGHVVHNFREKSVNGETFMDATIINQESLESMFQFDSFDVQRLLALRDRATDDQVSDSAQKLADSVNATLHQIQLDAEQVEQKVRAVLQMC